MKINKILISDIFLKGRENSDWKDGFNLLYGFRDAGYECDIAGVDCDIPETEIPKIARDYDLVIISENYWQYSGWKWWNWSEIKTKKLFWAIDTHLIDFTGFINHNRIDFVAFNNKNHIQSFPNMKSDKIWLPYGISKKHYDVVYSDKRIHDISFIGGMNPERKKYVDTYGMNHLQAYGPSYVKAMQESKICFNKSMSDDLNAKNMEIIGSGSFMLTNFNQHFLDFMENNQYIREMMYKDDNELDEKIRYYLSNDSEREEISKSAREYVFSKHSYANRSEYLINIIENI